MPSTKRGNFFVSVLRIRNSYVIIQVLGTGYGKARNVKFLKID